MSVSSKSIMTGVLGQRDRNRENARKRLGGNFPKLRTPRIAGHHQPQEDRTGPFSTASGGIKACSTWISHLQPSEL